MTRDRSLWIAAGASAGAGLLNLLGYLLNEDTLSMVLGVGFMLASLMLGCTQLILEELAPVEEEERDDDQS